MIKPIHMIVALMLLVLLLGSTQAFDPFYPFEAATGKIKTPAENLGGPWFQDNYGPAFGTDKDYYLKYDSANNSLHLTGLTFLIGPKTSVSNVSPTSSAVFTNATLKNFIAVDASGGNATETLPDAAAVGVPNVPIFITTKADPGNYYITVNATGGDKLGGSGGATSLMTTDAKAGLILISDGTNYDIAGAFGTWS